MSASNMLILLYGGGCIFEDEVLSERKKQILLGAVEEYIQCASPITSANVRNKFCNDLSTATLRNELNALEAMGYLRQLHTSSGRVPTAKGYRYFVNSIMGDVPLDKSILEEIHKIFDNRAIYLGDMVNEIADIVSKATNYPAVVMLKGFDKLTIKNVKIVPLMTGQALILIETNSGIINNFMPANADMPTQTYVDASNFLTTTFAGHTVADMIQNIENYRVQMGNELLDYVSIFDTMINSLKELSDKIASSGGVTARGELRLLNSPEYQDLDKAKRVIDVLTNPSELEQIFEDENDEEISFKIGAEIPVAELQDCAVARADYTVDGKSITSIRLLVPQRMDYAKIASALKFVVGEFANLKALDTTQKGEDNDDK